MGEAKRKKKSTRDLLKLPENGQCVFCGGEPETMDHFPPRCYFDKREWPEGYEYPSCKSCNEGKSKKEVAIVLLLKLQDLRTRKDLNFGKFLKFVRKHHPEVIDGLKLLTVSAAKRTRRDVTGNVETAAQLAVMGYESIELGAPSTHLYKELCEWLARSLYFQHLKRVFLDEIYIMYLARPAYSDPMLRGFFEGHSGQPQVSRNGKDLRKQFYYRYATDHESFSAIICFGEPQLYFCVLACPNREKREKFKEIAKGGIWLGAVRRLEDEASPAS